MEKGRFYGMGYVPLDIAISTVEDLKNYITPYSSNYYIRGLVYEYAEKYLHKKVVLV